MRAVIIDPWKRSVAAVEKPAWTLAEMYVSLSGAPPFRACDDINSLRIGRDQILWVDEEGLFIPEGPTWKLKGYPGVLAGMGLILGVDEMGENKGTHLDVDWVKSMVEWTTLVTTGALGETTYPAPNVMRLGNPILKEKG